MIYLSKQPFFSIDLKFKVGDLVIPVDDNTLKRITCPTVCRVLSVERPPKDYGLSDQKLEIQCIETGLTAKKHGGNVLKYDSFLIFSVMSMLSRMIEAHFSQKISLP